MQDQSIINIQGLNGNHAHPSTYYASEYQKTLTLIEKIKSLELEIISLASERGRLFKEMLPTGNIDLEILKKIEGMSLLTCELLKRK